MPLPPALAARLAKRGLLKANTADNEPVEEVIAEDYDDRPAIRLSIDSLSAAKISKAPPPTVVEPEHKEVDSEPVDETDELVHEVLLCPNRANSYHQCVEYCRQHWGCKRFKPDQSSTDRRERLLRRYPPPDGWLEVGDPETGRYYYWNIETDKVAWLPPQHPRAVITQPSIQRTELQEPEPQMEVDQYDSQGESEDEGSTDVDDENDDFEEIERELKRRVQSEKDRGKDHRRAGRRNADDTLDPMDPAAYSDVPRGGWTSGLEMRDTAKTGVDVTASGPLFQQRPYPSPGAVLRMNKDKK